LELGYIDFGIALEPPRLHLGHGLVFGNLDCGLVLLVERAKLELGHRDFFIVETVGLSLVLQGLLVPCGKLILHLVPLSKCRMDPWIHLGARVLSQCCGPIWASDSVGGELDYRVAISSFESPEFPLFVVAVARLLGRTGERIGLWGLLRRSPLPVSG